MNISQLLDFIEENGLIVLGYFTPDETEKLPAIIDDQNKSTTKTVLIVGNAGTAMFEQFQRWLSNGDNALSQNLLDEWTSQIGTKLAKRSALNIVYPFTGPPFWPFQKWLEAAGAAQTSPIGISIDAKFGLWSAVRMAVCLPEELPAQAITRIEAKLSRPYKRPCDSCTEKPCLQACPVGAIAADKYDTAKCADHVQSSAGSSCFYEGCLARRACPVGKEYEYTAEQMQFHMQAFLKNLA